MQVNKTYNCTILLSNRADGATFKVGAITMTVDDHTPTNDGVLIPQKQGARHVSDSEILPWHQGAKFPYQITSFTPASSAHLVHKDQQTTGRKVKLEPLSSTN